MTPDRDPQPVQLSPADGEVLDALLAAGGGDELSVGAASDADRVQRMSHLLRLMAQWPVEAAAGDLVARTLARVAVGVGRESSDSPATARATASSETDFDVLDQLLEATSHGDTNASRAIAQTQRGRRVSQWLDIIDHLPAEPPADDLVARTLSHIAVCGRRREVLAHIADHRPAAVAESDGVSIPAIAFRWSELIAVAAVLMIAVSLFWPMMAKTRSDAMRVACASNLQTAGIGLQNYAWDNGRVLPRYQTTLGSVWWNVGQPVQDGLVQSNSAHLYKLRRENYVSAATLNCPTNGEAPQQLATSAFDWPNPRAVSYSYQNQYTAEPVRVGRTGSMVILADKNPLFTPQVDPATGANAVAFDAAHGLDIPGNRHAKPGQQVLLIDGSSLWAQSNSINGDNFYTVRNVQTYRGTESPSIAGDSFVVP